MEPERRHRISDLFHAALGRAPEERPAFLEGACGGDRALRQEIESLLRFHSDNAPFLETPAMNVVAGGEPSRIGQQLGPYRILGALGAGGMGEVYRARDSKLGRDVAIKMLPELFTADPERRARFAREARLLATLNHPHIGAIYGLEDLEGQTALVLELVEGPTLAQRLERGPVPVAEALAVARQVADALDAAHQKNIIHRDLKPANIVLQDGRSSEPRVKVLDFGLATTGLDGAAESEQVSMTNQRTEAGRILGTPAYMSPEQARGQAVDKRSDIWAFGCVLFEMLSGHRPFGGKTVTDTLARILEHEPEWTALPLNTPASMRMLLQRCLRKDPEKRLHDIADARIEIDDRDLVPASTPDKGPRPGRAVKWTVAALLILSPLAAILIVQRRAPPPAAEPFEFTIGPPENATFPPRYGGFAVSPDGRHLVVTLAFGNRTSLWVRPVGTPQYREIPGTEGAIFPFWKPDSLEIGFFAGGKLKTVPLRGGIPNVVCDAPEESEYDEVGGTWNRDDVIVFMSSAYTLVKVSARAGAPPVPITTLAQGEIAHRWPSFLPDGQHFLYIALGQTGDFGELRIGSMDGGPPTALGRYESNALYAAGYLLFLSGEQLVARRFDASARQVIGPPLPVATTSRFATWHRLGAFSVSESGVLAHHPGGAIVSDQRLTWRDRTGRVGASVGEIGRFTNVDLSPDGKRLAVAVGQTGKNTDIWTIDLARGDTVPLTTHPAYEFDPSWSHDGKRIVFNSDRNAGRFGLFSRASDGSGQDDLVVTAVTGASTPIWSPLDRSILYDDDGDLWILPLDGDHKPSVVWKTKAREKAGAFRRTAIGSPTSRTGQVAQRSMYERFLRARQSTKCRVTEGWHRDGALTGRRSSFCPSTPHCWLCGSRRRRASMR
jgi:serine/threonine protein kinase